MNLPNEISIEVESRCNFNCSFCFNKNSFAENGRKINKLSTNYTKKIIDEIWLSGIDTVRFTGGEPLLRRDIFDLCAYAKKRGLYVKLNTNASLINNEIIARKISTNVDDILISIRSSNNKKESEIANFPNSLYKKIEAIKILKKFNIKKIRISTVILKESVDEFEEMAELFTSLNIDEWGWYRPVTLNKVRKKLIDNVLVKRIVEKIYIFKKNSKINIHIGNSIPFCAIENPERLQKICYQVFVNKKYNRLVIDPRGFVKSHYFVDKNVGDPLNILKALDNTFFKKINRLPKKCQKCQYKQKCKGGSRYEAKLFSGKYNGDDFLANYRNINSSLSI